MTLDTKKLRKLLAASTPGPWETFAGINDDGNWSACGPTHVPNYDADETSEPGDVAEQAAQCDAALIAALRNSAEELIAAAEERERLRAVMKTIHPRPSHGLVGDIRCVADRLSSNSEAWEELLRERDAALARVREVEAKLEAQCAEDATLINIAIARAERAEKALRKLVHSHDGMHTVDCSVSYFEGEETTDDEYLAGQEAEVECGCGATASRNEARAALKGGE